VGRRPEFVSGLAWWLPGIEFFRGDLQSEFDVGGLTRTDLVLADVSPAARFTPDGMRERIARARDVGASVLILARLDVWPEANRGRREQAGAASPEIAVAAVGAPEILKTDELVSEGALS